MIFCVALTSIMAVLLVGIGVQIGRSDKGESDGDNDIKLYVRNRDRDRSSVVRYSPEEVTSVLTVLRMGASEHEKQVIDYLMDRLGGNDEDVL